MLQGITFDKQKMKSEDMAHITNMFFQGEEGITRGCNISVDANGDLVVSEGYFSVQGRLVKNVGNTIVEVPTVQSGILYSVLVFEVDLSKENDQELFNQGTFKIISNASSYPTLTKQDLENGGAIYQMEFCRFQNTTSGVTSLVDTRQVFNLDMYALGDDFKATRNNIIYYVNKSNGNNNNDGLTVATAFRDLQYAINKVPKFLKHNVTIRVLAGNYVAEGQIILSNFYSIAQTTSPLLKIVAFNGTSEVLTANTSYSIHSANIFNIKSNLLVGGFFVEKAGIDAGIYLSESDYVTLSGLMDNTNVSRPFIQASGTNGIITGCGIANKSQGIIADFGCNIVSENNTGGSNAIGLQAGAGGLIVKRGAQPTGTTAEYTSEGGRIV